MQRTCSSTHSLSKGLLRLSHSEKLSPVYYRHYIRNYSSVFNRSKNYNYSLPNRLKPRYASSSSGSTKSGGGKAAVLGGFTVVSLVGGTLGYAGIDSDFRAYIEELVPGAKEAFEVILGNVKSTEGIENANLAISNEVVPSKLKPISVDLKENNERTDLASVEILPPPLEKETNIDESEKQKSLVSQPPLPSTSKFPTSFQQIPPKTTSTEKKEPDNENTDTSEKSVTEVTDITADEEKTKVVDDVAEETIELDVKSDVQDIPKDVVHDSEEKVTEQVANVQDIPENIVQDAEEKVTEQVADKEQDVVEIAPPTASSAQDIIDEASLSSVQIGQLSSTSEPILLNSDIPSDLDKRPDIVEIESAVSAMNFLIEEAEKYEEICKNAVKNHSVLVEKVLENAIGKDNDADDGSWTGVFDAANKKAEALEMAQIQIQEAKSGIKRALEAVEVAKASNDIKIAASEIVSNSDEQVNRALLKIQSVSQAIETAVKDSKLVEEYRNLVEEGRQQFRTEIAALFPDTSPEGLAVKRGPLSEDELDVFVTHAYRKVCRLEQDLAKQKTLAQQRLETSVTDEQLRKQVVTEEVVQAELEAQRRLLDVEHQRKMAGIREEMENEVRSQLRRQAAAHADHVKDVIEVEKSELQRKHDHELEESISRERSAHHKELSSLAGRVDGINVVIGQRAELESKIRKAQELWLASKALNLALSTDTSPDGILPPIQREVDVLRNVANKVKSVSGEPKNSIEMVDFVKSVLDSIPKEALSRGVYSDKALRDRYFRVENIAKRTALIKNENPSLFMYFLSYLQSLVMLQPTTEKLPSSDISIDIDDMSNNDAITLARACVERGDIAQAIRYLNLLKGESAKVSKDWIKEARLFLETQQACDALLAHAAAFGLEIFPHKESPKEKKCCH